MTFGLHVFMILALTASVKLVRTNLKYGVNEYKYSLNYKVQHYKSDKDTLGQAIKLANNYLF